jgi:hypothetical protein
VKISILVWGLLCAVAFPCYAQNWTPQDSLRLNRLLKGEGEVKLNPEVLQELEMNNSLGTPKAVMDKSWMDFDNSLPVMPKAPEKKVVHVVSSSRFAVKAEEEKESSKFDKK